MSDWRGDLRALVQGLCIAAIIVAAILGLIYSSNERSAKTGTTPKRAAFTASTGNDAHDQLTALGSAGQAVVLAKAVNDRCVGTEAFYMGMSAERQAFWSVRCADGRAYEVAIDPDGKGSSTVLDCAILKTVAKVDCFVRLSEQGK